MRIKTIPGIVTKIKKLDPSSAVGESFLTALAESKQLPHTYHGNRKVLDAEAIVPTLNSLLGFEGNGNLPHIRTIREAAAELRQSPFDGHWREADKECCEGRTNYEHPYRQ